APVRSRLGHRTGPARRDGHRRLAPTWHRLLTPAQLWPLLLWPGRVHHLIADPGAHRVGFPVLAADGYLVAIHEPDVPERFGVRVLLPVADRGFTGDLRARRVPQRFEHGLVQFGLALQWCGFGREQHAHAGVLLRPIGLPLRSGFGEVPALRPVRCHGDVRPRSDAVVSIFAVDLRVLHARPVRRRGEWRRGLWLAEAIRVRFPGVFPAGALPGARSGFPGGTVTVL